jgi:hypothetical protein
MHARTCKLTCAQIHAEQGGDCLAIYRQRIGGRASVTSLAAGVGSEGNTDGSVAGDGGRRSSHLSFSAAGAGDGDARTLLGIVDSLEEEEPARGKSSMPWYVCHLTPTSQSFVFHVGNSTHGAKGSVCWYRCLCRMGFRLNT